jgi:hypothetical protein
MKKITLLLVAATMVLVCACGNNPGKKKTEAKESVEEQYIKADLKIKLDSLVKEMGRLSTPVIVDIQNGKLTLTDKEKRNKPSYLLPASKADEAVTLNEKYRAVAMLSADMTIAELYGMPVDSYKQAIAKLLVDINNPALNIRTDGQPEEALDTRIQKFYEESVKTGTVNLFWEAIVAGTVEQLFIITQNIDKFIPCFDDKAAAEVTYRFVLVHEGIKSLIPYHPELEQLQTILKPLEVINAVNVDQFRDQLTELKGTIETARTQLL